MPDCRNRLLLVVERVLEAKIRDASGNRDRLGRGTGEALEPRHQSVVAVSGVVGDRIDQQRIGGIAQLCSGAPGHHRRLRKEVGRLVHRRDGLREQGAAVVRLELPPDQGLVLEDQIGPPRRVVDDDGVVDSGRILDQHRAVDPGERVGRRHGDLVGRRGCRHVEGHGARDLVDQLDSPSPRKESHFPGLVAIDAGEPGRLVRRVGETHLAGWPAEGHRVAAGSGIDDQISEGTEIDALHVDPIVTGAGDQLDPLDVDDRFELHPGPVDPLDGAAVDHLGVEVEGVAEHGADEDDRIEPGAAVDADVGVGDIGERIDVGFAGGARCLRGVAPRAGLPADGGDATGHLLDGSRGIEREERLDEERVVAVVAEERDVGDGLADLEVVVAGAAEERGRERRAAGDLRHHAHVLTVDEDIFRAENRPDEERVVATEAVDVERLGRVVADEGVVLVATADDDRLDGGVVEDLEAIGGGQHRRLRCLEYGGRFRQRRHTAGIERRRIGRLPGDDQASPLSAIGSPTILGELAIGILALPVDGVELDDVGLIGEPAVVERVDAARARIGDLDEGHARRHRGAAPDEVLVAPLSAVEDEGAVARATEAPLAFDPVAARAGGDCRDARRDAFDRDRIGA